MFSGIITDVGRVDRIVRGGDTRLEIRSSFDPASIDLGASIAHSGICLTVVERLPAGWAVEASAETLSKTTLGGWEPGTELNLERSLKLGDEIGGHLVYGHVDGVGSVVDIRPEGDSLRFTFEAPVSIAPFIASKGSIAVDGVSLTVNEVQDEAGGTCRFGINIIPHTRQCTTFRNSRPGHRVNLEVDMLARYLARLNERRPATPD